MKQIIPIFIAAMLVLSGCAESPVVPPAKKDGLRKLLAPTFAITSVPKEREEDFYRVLEVFARDAKGELIERVEFTSGGEATVQFLWSIHGGSATIRKRWGKWTVVDKSYFV